MARITSKHLEMLRFIREIRMNIRTLMLFVSFTALWRELTRNTPSIYGLSIITFISQVLIGATQVCSLSWFKCQCRTWVVRQCHVLNTRLNLPLEARRKLRDLRMLHKIVISVICGQDLPRRINVFLCFPIILIMALIMSNFDHLSLLTLYQNLTFCQITTRNFCALSDVIAQPVNE